MKIAQEFKDFALRGNVLDLAVGIIIGGAFNGIVNSLVNDIIMPPIGLVLKRVNFSNLYVNLSDRKFASFQDAKNAGVPTINYGAFINNLISFLIIAVCVFLIVRAVNRIQRLQQSKAAPPSPTIKTCPFCFSTIPIKAVRCPHCTSDLREKRE